MEIIYLDRLFSQLYLLPPLLGSMFHISSEVLSREGRRQRGVFCSAAEREMAPTRQMVAKGGEGGRTQLKSELQGREDAEYQDQVNNYEIKFETIWPYPIFLWYSQTFPLKSFGVSSFYLFNHKEKFELQKELIFRRP